MQYNQGCSSNLRSKVIGLTFAQSHQAFRFFKDSKRLLNLVGCSAKDFSSQIAHVSLVMIRYNLLASVKQSLDYETIGGVFNDIFAGVHELTVMEKIREIIIEVVAVVAEIIGADEEELMIQIIENDRRLAALKAYAQAA